MWQQSSRLFSNDHQSVCSNSKIVVGDGLTVAVEDAVGLAVVLAPTGLRERFDLDAFLLLWRSQRLGTGLAFYQRRVSQFAQRNDRHGQDVGAQLLKARSNRGRMRSACRCGC
jgi:GGDEF domain-containing protein